MYEIQTNAKGSRQMFVTDENLKTIEKYGLFQQLVDSSGIIDEMVLEKLRLNVRALIEAEPDKADLVDLCQGVLFHDNMTALGSDQLVKLYVNWQEKHQEIAHANVLEAKRKSRR